MCLLSTGIIMILYYVRRLELHFDLRHINTSLLHALFMFSWDGKRRKKKKRGGGILVCKPYDDGGMAMPDIFNFSSAMKIL